MLFQILCIYVSILSLNSQDRVVGPPVIGAPALAPLATLPPFPTPPPSPSFPPLIAAPAFHPLDIAIPCFFQKRNRKEWNTATTAERQLYIDGLLALSAVGRLQKFTQQHAHLTANSQAHGKSGFLPWHRKFLLELEDAVRSLGTPYRCWTLLYWNWAKDYNDYGTSYSQYSVLNSNLGSNGVSTDNWCVHDGAFQKGSYTPSQCTSMFQGTDNVCCLKRNNAGDGTAGFYSAVNMMNYITSNALYGDDYPASAYGYREALEGTAHGWAHCTIGACSGFDPNRGHLGDIQYSPDDPIFYLLHTFIDYQWALWQDCWDYDLVNKNSITSNIYDGSYADSDVDATLSFTTLAAEAWSSITGTEKIRDMHSIQDLNYRYEKGSFFPDANVDILCNNINPNWFYTPPPTPPPSFPPLMVAPIGLAPFSVVPIPTPPPSPSLPPLMTAPIGLAPARRRLIERPATAHTATAEMNDDEERRVLQSVPLVDDSQQIFEIVQRKYESVMQRPEGRKALVSEWDLLLCELQTSAQCRSRPKYFDDCSDMIPTRNPQTGLVDIDITYHEMIRKVKDFPCMVAVRNNLYGWCKGTGTLWRLCRGEYDLFCDKTFVNDQTEDQCKLKYSTQQTQTSAAQVELGNEIKDNDGFKHEFEEIVKNKDLWLIVLGLMNIFIILIGLMTCFKMNKKDKNKYSKTIINYDESSEDEQELSDQ